MNDQTRELQNWLTLSLVPDMRLTLFKKLLSCLGSLEGICAATPAALAHCRLNDKQIQAILQPDQAEIDRAIGWMQAKNHHILTVDDPRYPPLLATTTTAPVVLYVLGEWEILHQPQLAMVGSRNPSHTGLELAYEFAGQLAQSGWIVTSGLALGIDGACHHGALDVGGKTIAVLGSGLQELYPKSHQILAERIVTQGCVISEFPLTQKPIARHFPKRNRIISGLSRGTLVVEAALKSGSLITARFALEQNREVFAIPGSVRNPLSMGCLSLIQQGAKCVTHVNDILEEFQFHLLPFRTKNTVQKQLTLDWQDNPVLACIDTEVATIDQICARSKLSAQQVAATLVELELNGVVKRHFDGFIRIHNR